MVKKPKLSHSRKKTREIYIPHRSVDNSEIEDQKTTKYLAVILDQKFTFKDHIQYIRTFTARKVIGSSIQKTTPISIKHILQIYKAYALAIILYPAPVWSSVSKTNLARLDVI